MDCDGGTDGLTDRRMGGQTDGRTDGRRTAEQTSKEQTDMDISVEDTKTQTNGHAWVRQGRQTDRQTD
eukprot:2691882-Alexandrium_andersonii.AAC.1